MAKFRLIVNSFGLNVLRFKIYADQKDRPETPTKSSGKFNVDDIEIVSRMDTGASDVQRLSYLGTPIFADIGLLSKGGDDLVNLDTVLISISQNKNILTTAVQGRKGTIKEYVSDGDYQISMKGALVSADGYSYPTDQVKALHDVLKLSEAITVVSPFLQLFGVYDMVVESFNFPQSEGFQNVQLFEINGMSDEPIELVEDF